MKYQVYNLKVWSIKYMTTYCNLLAIALIAKSRVAILHCASLRQPAAVASPLIVDVQQYLKGLGRLLPRLHTWQPLLSIHLFHGWPSEALSSALQGGPAGSDDICGPQRCFGLSCLLSCLYGSDCGRDVEGTGVKAALSMMSCVAPLAQVRSLPLVGLSPPASPYYATLHRLIVWSSFESRGRFIYEETGTCHGYHYVWV